MPKSALPLLLRSLAKFGRESVLLEILETIKRLL